MPPTVTVHPLPAYDPPLEPADDPARQLELALPLQRTRSDSTPILAPPAQDSATLEEAAALAGAHAALRLIIEVLDGRRPAAHLDRAASPRVRDYVEALASGIRVRRQPGSAAWARIRSVHLQQPCHGAAEVSVVWQRAGQIAALAARFELTEGARPLGWRCTALRLG